MNKILKALCLATILLLPLVGCNDNPDTEEITIQKQIDNGGTVDLKDDTISEDVTINKAVTLKNADFDGHTITVNADTTLIDIQNAHVVIENQNIILTIQNSSIASITVKTNNTSIVSLGTNVKITSLEIESDVKTVDIYGGQINTLKATEKSILNISGKAEIKKTSGKVNINASNTVILPDTGYIELTITSIKLIQSNNIKHTYEVGDSFDFTGLSVKVTYNNNTTQEIPLSRTNTKVIGFSTSQEGNLTVSFTYNDVSVDGTLSITVTASSLDPSEPTPTPPSTQDYKKLLNEAVSYFAELELDDGISKIEEAYNVAKNDTTKMYYALAKLALISTNSDTVNFMKNTCGFEHYPNNFYALINKAWWEDCLNDGFAEKVANANPNGLNGALNKVVDIIQNTYNEILGISKNMEQASVLLPAELINAFELDYIFGSSDIRVGKAELDVIIAAMGIVKGTLEYISAFDWTFDTSAIKTGMDIDDFVTAVKSGTNLLTATKTSRLAESRESFLTAVDLAISSYNYIIYESNIYPTEVKDTLGDYSIFYEAAKALKNALTNDETFYVPDTDIFELNAWPTSENDSWLVKIDCGKMFSANVLDNAIGKTNGTVDFYTTYSYYNGYGHKYVNEETLLTESFYSVHEKNVAEVKENATYYWDCNTQLLIKVRLPDCITIKGIENNDRETFLPIWGEYTDSYDYYN